MLTAFATVLLATSAHAAIFGLDLRQDVTASSAYASRGEAVAVAVLSSNIAPSVSVPGSYKLDASALGDGFVCKDERFASDPSLSYSCSGFLVAPDLLVTAGHCQVNVGESKNESGMYCEAYGWLFGYQNDSAGHARLDGLPADDFYKCKRIIYAVREETYPYRDYALVQLERPVAGRRPFKLATKPVAKGDTLTMIGFPFGTPMKVSPFGRVTLNDPVRQTFLTNLSAFEGNSGSVVYNSQQEAVGILVAGTPSANTVTDTVKSCERYNRCDLNGENCTKPDTAADIRAIPGYQGVGSEVQRIDPILELINGLK